VTSDLISDIITQDHFNVRILSIREVQNLNHRKLQQALIYAVRPSRPARTPKLKGLYFFGPKDAAPISRLDRRVTNHAHDNSAADIAASRGGVIYSQGAQIGARWNQISGDTLAEEMVRGGDKWYSRMGRVLAKPPSIDWAETMYACQGIISFDAVLCHGPHHSALEAPSGDTSKSTWYKNPHAHIPPRVATHSIGGCSCCQTAPERFSKFGSSPLGQFPLLAPPPLHSSTAKAAKAPFVGSGDKLLLRCMDCLRTRFCESCHKWWCEDCYEIPSQGHAGGSQQLWEAVGTALGGHTEKNVKVHIGLCIEDCLVAEMMSGAGSSGMWG
jgi:hypothetical protein